MHFDKQKGKQIKPWAVNGINQRYEKRYQLIRLRDHRRGIRPGDMLKDGTIQNKFRKLSSKQTFLVNNFILKSATVMLVTLHNNVMLAVLLLRIDRSIPQF